MEINQIIEEIETKQIDVLKQLQIFEKKFTENLNFFKETSNNQKFKLDKQMYDMKYIMSHLNKQHNKLISHSRNQKRIDVDQQQSQPPVDLINVDQNASNININHQGRRNRFSSYTSTMDKIYGQAKNNTRKIPLFDAEFKILCIACKNIKQKESKLNQIIQWFKRWNLEADFAQFVILKLLSQTLSVMTKDTLLQLVLDFSKHDFVLRIDQDNRSAWPVRKDHLHLPNLLIRNHNIDLHYDTTQKKFKDMRLFLRSEQQLSNQHLGHIVVFSQHRDRDQVEEEQQAEEFDRFVRVIKDNGAQTELSKIRFYQDLLELDKTLFFSQVDQYIIFNKYINFYNEDYIRSNDIQHYQDLPYNQNIFSIPYKNLKNIITDKINEVNARRDIKFSDWRSVGITTQDLETQGNQLGKQEVFNIQNLKQAQTENRMEDLLTISNQLNPQEIDEDNLVDLNNQFTNKESVLNNSESNCEYDIMKRLSKGIKFRHQESFRSQVSKYDVRDNKKHKDNRDFSEFPNSQNDTKSASQNANIPSENKCATKNASSLKVCNLFLKKKTNEKKVKNEYFDGKIGGTDNSKSQIENTNGVFYSPFQKNQTVVFQKQGFKLVIVNRNSKFLTVRNAWFFSNYLQQQIKDINQTMEFNFKEEQLQDQLQNDTNKFDADHINIDSTSIPNFNQSIVHKIENLQNLPKKDEVKVENNHHENETSNQSQIVPMSTKDEIVMGIPHNQFNDAELVYSPIVQPQVQHFTQPLEFLMTKKIPKLNKFMGAMNNRINQVSVLSFIFNSFNICKQDSFNRIQISNQPQQLINFMYTHYHIIMDFVPDPRSYINLKNADFSELNSAQIAITLIYNNPVINEFFRRFNSVKQFKSRKIINLMDLMNVFIGEGDFRDMLDVVQNQMNLNMNKQYYSSKEVENVFKLQFSKDQNRQLEQSQFNLILINQHNKGGKIPILNNNLNLSSIIYQSGKNLELAYEKYRFIKFNELFHSDDPIHKDLIFNYQDYDLQCNITNIQNRINTISIDFFDQGITNSQLILYNCLNYKMSGTLEYLMSQDLKERKKIILDIKDLEISHNMIENSIFSEKKKYQNDELNQDIVNSNLKANINQDNLSWSNLYNQKQLNQINQDQDYILM